MIITFLWVIFLFLNNQNKKKENHSFRQNENTHFTKPLTKMVQIKVYNFSMHMYIKVELTEKLGRLVGVCRWCECEVV